jgi:hypothetical protein
MYLSHFVQYRCESFAQGRCISFHTVEVHTFRAGEVPMNIFRAIEVRMNIFRTIEVHMFISFVQLRCISFGAREAATTRLRWLSLSRIYSVSPLSLAPTK